MPAAVNSSVRSGESRGALGSLRWSCPSKNRRKPSRISAEFTFHLMECRSYQAPAHENSISSAPREARTATSLFPRRRTFSLLRFALQCFTWKRSLDSGRGHDVQGIGGKVLGGGRAAVSPRRRARGVVL